MKWGAHWSNEPPVLIQIRNILAQLAAMVGNGLGAKPSLSAEDFLPVKESEEDRIEAERQSMLLWAARHNATIQ